MSRNLYVFGAILAALFPASQALANCASKWSQAWQMPINSSHYGDSLADVLSLNGFFREGSVRNSDNRLSFTSTPGGTPGIRMNVPKGENKIVSFDTGPFKAPGAEKVCLSVDVYFESGFDWNTAGTKLGIGLWGGDTDSKNSGGWPPELQEGWSIRMLNSAKGVRAYAYHLNRTGSQTNESRCAPYKCEYGDSLGDFVHVNKGAWNNIQVEVQMNTIGSSNGVLRAWVNGKEVVSNTNMLWRKKSSWAIRGLKFTDMWGGNTSASVNFSPRKQEMFYRNFKLSSSSSSSSSTVSSLSSTNSGSSGSGSGSFSPVQPVANVKIKPFSRVIWNSHADADKYYVRIIDRNRSVTRMQSTFAAYQIGCFGGGRLCDVPLSGSSLQNGEHRMILRAIKNGKSLKEYSFDFNISSDGVSSTNSTTSSSTTASSSGSSSGSSWTSADGFAPINPTAGSKLASLPTIAFGSHSRAGQYYIRLIDRARSTNRILTKLDAGKLGCGSGGTCTYNTGNLSLNQGQHRLIVRALDGSTKLSEFTIDFEISANGTTASYTPASLTSTSSGSTSSSGGQVSALSPQGSTTDNSPTLRWSGGNYDKYYLKMVSSSGQTVFGSSISPSQASCTSDTTCDFTIPSQSNGSYTWMVRGVYNGKAGAYSSLDLAIR